MGITFDKSRTMAEVLAQAMEQWHPILQTCRVRVDVLEVTNTGKYGITKPALKEKGWPVPAKTLVVPLQRRAMGQGDVLVLVDHHQWDETNTAACMAIMDHELEHLEVLAEKDPRENGTPIVGWSTEAKCLVGAPLLDDRGRPRLRLRKHDWQLGGFRSVVERHREASVEAAAVKACLQDDGQYMWEWAVEAEVIEPMKAKRKMACA
jgi:hypothetical protein